MNIHVKNSTRINIDTDTIRLNNKHTILILDDDGLGVDHDQAAGGEPEHREDTTQRVGDIVLASLASGALSDVCEVMAEMRELDDKESDQVKEFVSRSCGCDFGPKKTPCSMLFPVEHYQSPQSHLR